MALWQRPISLDILNQTSENTLIEHLQIAYSEITDNSISATMPVAPITHQPLGMLHGGASVVLAETLGTVAAYFSVAPPAYCVGVEINANHVRSIREGLVTGTATPCHLGRVTHVWQIEIRDQDQHLISTSRMTVMVKQG